MQNKKVFLAVAGAALIALAVIGISNAITEFSEQSPLSIVILVAYSVCFFLGVLIFVGTKQARIPAILLCALGALLNLSELFDYVNQKDIAEIALFVIVTLLLVWDLKVDV